MRLLRLELQGFKSFLDRTILTFEPGVTGVVGPNGCGKSNIVDAILWVMGEQSPKHLRGDSMTDIIFNGSDSRAATSMAEVSLVMDRQGVALAPQFAMFDKGDEISVTRRIYRDGTGEFFINKMNCRLKDIHELFMDTGVGRRAYSIIEQGQIDRMINVKPEERRFLFEEVAGITKYKAKRKEAEKKLELTRQNLLRIQDIITELEKQIRSLKIQATKARKYKEIKTELEVVDLFLLGRNLSIHQQQLNELEALKNELITTRSESDALFAQVDADVTALDVKRIDQEKAYQEMSAKERELSLVLQKVEGQIGLYEERSKFIQQSNEDSLKEEEQIRVREEELEHENEQQESERAVLSTDIEEIARQVGQLEQEMRLSQDAKQRAQTRRSQTESRSHQLTEKEIHLGNQKQYGETKLEEIETSRVEIEEKITTIAQTLEGQRVLLTEAETKIADCQERGANAERAAANLYTECQQTSVNLSELEEQLFQLRENFHGKKSRLESLTELQENLEGYSPTAKEVLIQLADSGKSAIPLAEAVQPEAGLEDHVEMLLGADMNTLLVPTTEEAESLARLIEEKGLERVRIGAVSEMATGDANLPSLEGAEPLINRVRVKSGYEAAAQRWLGNVYLCDGLNRVLELRRAYPSATFFTLNSRLIAHSDRTLTSGTSQIKMGVFARRREIEELTGLCADLEAQLNKATADREDLLQRLETQEKQHAEMKETLSAIHIESVEYRKERERVQADVSRSEREQNSHLNEMDRNRNQAATVQGQIAQWNEELAAVKVERENVQKELIELEAEIEATIQRFDSILNSMNELKIERSRLAERMNGLQYKVEKISSEIAMLQAKYDSLRTQRLSDEKELLRLESETVEMRSQQKLQTEERDAMLIQIADVKTAFNETCSDLQERRIQKDELQEKRAEIGEKLQDIEVKIAQERSQLEQMKSISLERYHKEPEAIGAESRLAIESLPLLAGQLNVTWELQLVHEQEELLREHLKNLREKIERYGEVNLTAIQEFDEVQNRFDFLMNQKTDLDNSIKILEEAIVKIDETTKSRFADTFEAVNRKFKEIFPILFNGGKAELTLTNAENLLEAGVDVMVQPPGKRLQSITLLSGGEKALTAVSLILAIFARKPSPFCLLDEVDAPLDDANVSRFNTVIRKMAEKTQFIVITHNKKTMEIAEGLYGVTMERAGISKMTSVRLN